MFVSVILVFGGLWNVTFSEKVLHRKDFGASQYTPRDLKIDVQ